MAIVKILFRQNADKVLNYVFAHSQPGDPVDSEYVPPNPDQSKAEFKMIREQHNHKEGYNEAIHLIQSWDESESKKLTPETVNGMGKELVTNYFKGHQSVIVTHTETGKLHNHIVINTVNFETGKLVKNRFKHLHELRKINDRICLDRGLSIPNQDATMRQAKIPQQVQQMVKAGKQSYIWDMKNKADVARSLSTSYDQYVDYLDALGVKGRVEEKNITYFYPGRSRGKRGDKLGKNYDKPGLEKQFKQNDDRFKANPEARQQLLQQYQGSQTPFQEIQKNYSHYTKQSRHEQKTVPASERELTSQIIPAAEIRKAKRSILEYCQENNIALSLNANGQNVLKGRDHVVIHGNEATNTRNGTRATLIDFVAAHHRITLLQAVAKINGTEGPLLVERHFGAVERKFTAFYIPKPDQMPFAQATEHLSKFLKANQASPRVADSLLKHQRAEVSKNGTIRLFGESDSAGTLEFSEGKDGTWNEKKQGTFQQPFYKHAARGNRLFVFTNPRAYLSGRGQNAFSERSHRDGVLVLMEPNASHVENYLSENKEIRRVHLVSPKAPSPQHSLDFFNVLKHRLTPKGLDVGMISEEKALERESPGLSI